MDLSFTKEENEFREKVRTWLEDNRPRAARLVPPSHQASSALIRPSRTCPPRPAPINAAAAKVNKRAYSTPGLS